MANAETDQSGLSQELRAAVRREAVATSAKWAIGLVVLLMGFALTGWWLYLREKVIDIVGGVPSRAVMAFDSSAARPCPTGWEIFKEATSRTIIGAGDRSEFFAERYATDERGRPLTLRSARQLGGEEVHQLTIEEMPTHSHRYSSEVGVDGNRSGRQDATFGRVEHSTSEVGGNQPHNNMAPFVALYFCVKS